VFRSGKLEDISSLGYVMMVSLTAGVTQVILVMKAPSWFKASGKG